MTWQGIAGGANGLIYYSYTYLMKSPTTSFEKGFADVCTVAQEVRDFVPILLSDGMPPSFKVRDERLAVRTWRQDAKLYLLAVNRSREDLEGTVVLQARVSKIRPLFGEGFIKADGGTLSFHMKPIGQTLLELDGLK